MERIDFSQTPEGKALHISEFEQLYSILTTDFDNKLPRTVPTNSGSISTDDPYWTYGFVGGQTFLVNETPEFEWPRVLSPYDSLLSFPEAELSNEMLAGVSGTVVYPAPESANDAHPELSKNDVPFTHPFGNDFEFFVAPDTQYLQLLGITNAYLHEAASWLQVKGEYDAGGQRALAAKPQGLALSSSGFSGLLGVEVDQGLVPPDYRPADGERVVVFGRWIVDAGHPDFHTEIHPPLLMVSARPPIVYVLGKPTTRDLKKTHATLIGRPYLPKQIFHDDSGNPHGLRAALEAFLTSKVTSFILSTNIPVQTTEQVRLVAGVEPGFPGFGDYAAAVTMNFSVRPTLPRQSKSDVLLLSYHLTCREGCVPRVINNGDDSVRIEVAIGSFGKFAYNAPPVPPPGGQEVTIHLADLQNQELTAALAQKVAQVAQDHGADVGQYLQNLINNGAITLTYPEAAWPVAPDNQVNVVAAVQVTSLPSDGTAQVATDNTQPFPIYGYVDVWWE